MVLKLPIPSSICSFGVLSGSLASALGAELSLAQAWTTGAVFGSFAGVLPVLAGGIVSFAGVTFPVDGLGVSSRCGFSRSFARAARWLLIKTTAATHTITASPAA